MAENSKQNLITMIAIIIALVAVVFALTQQMDKGAFYEGANPSYEISEGNPVSLVVDGEEVSRMEIIDNFTMSGSQVPQGAELEKLFPLMQEQYLVGRLLLRGAEDNGIDISHSDVSSRVANAITQAKRAVYIEKIGNDAVSEEALQKAYDDIVTQTPEITERRARHILLETEEAANALIIKLNNGEDFAKLAQENSVGPTASKGGDLGYFAQGEMVPEFSAAAFTLPVGEMTNSPVKTQFGYHIIKVEDERARQKPELDQVRAQLEQQLRQAVVGEKLRELRENADVTIFDYNGKPYVLKQATEEVPSEEPSDESSEEVENKEDEQEQE